MDIYVPHHERAALSAIDTSELEKRLDQAINEERSGCLAKLNLSRCGDYVARCLHSFERALSAHREAKSVRKRSETWDYLQKMKRELSFAVHSMQRRVEEETQEEQKFRVEGEMFPPFRFSKRLTATVRYQWRKSVDDWIYGSITFLHLFDPLDLRRLQSPKRKLSARKQEEELQTQLAGTWEQLMRGALYSVQEFFKEGGHPSGVPEKFEARVDGRGYLNNFSTVFWEKEV